MSDNVTPEERQALLVEYQVCEQDNDGNFQGYWTLAAIFFGISSALLAGLIYGILSNESLFNSLFCKNEIDKTLTVGIIAIILAIANIIIIKKLKGWHKRIMYNQRNNSRRMREIELKIGYMSREWRTYAINKWRDKKFPDKRLNLCNEQIWQRLKPILMESVDDTLVNNIGTLEKTLVREIKQYIKEKEEGTYESTSSKKHYRWILYTLLSLWVLVLSAAVFLIIDAHCHWQWGLIASVLVILYVYYLIRDIRKLNKIGT